MAVCRFRARLYAVGVNRCIDVPQEVSHALGGQTHIRVRGVIGSEEFRSHIAPRGRGKHRLFVHSRIWRKLCIDIGDVVKVAIERDDDEWEVSIPRDVADAMPAGSEVIEALEALTTPNRKRFFYRGGLPLGRKSPPLPSFPRRRESGWWVPVVRKEGRETPGNGGRGGGECCEDVGVVGFPPTRE